MSNITSCTIRWYSADTCYRTIPWNTHQKQALLQNFLTCSTLLIWSECCSVCIQQLCHPTYLQLPADLQLSWRAEENDLRFVVLLQIRDFTRVFLLQWMLGGCLGARSTCDEHAARIVWHAGGGVPGRLSSGFLSHRGAVNDQQQQQQQAAVAPSIDWSPVIKKVIIIRNGHQWKTNLLLLISHYVAAQNNKRNQIKQQLCMQHTLNL